MVSGNGISPLCPFIDSLDTSYTVGYKDVGVEYLTFCWRRLFVDILSVSDGAGVSGFLLL